MTANTTQPEMPRYKCHKEVRALKIKKVSPAEGGTSGGVDLHFEEAGFASMWMPVAFKRQHGPHAGGYLVVYPDGYKSFSPAKAFEEGYTRL